VVKKKNVEKNHYTNREAIIYRLGVERDLGNARKKNGTGEINPETAP